MSTTLVHYLESWALSDPEPLAQTATSTVYTVTHQGEKVVLKLLTPVGIHDEQSGAVALQYWDGHSAVKLLRHDHAAHLLEYADGEDLTALVMRGQDVEATEIIADVLNRLHAHTSPPPNGLHLLDRRFRSLFERAEQAPDSIYARGARVAEALLADPRDVRVLHGDMHHWNVRGTERGWLTFDPKGVLGERTYDAANTLSNPNNRPDLILNEARLLRNAEILARIMRVDLGRLLAYTFAYSCLSAAWSLEDGDDPALALGAAEIVERHLRPA
jgi:streptomycin 6-kinase